MRITSTLSFIFILAAFSVAHAQTANSTLRGVVLDPSKGLIAGAIVTVVSDSGKTLETKTDSEGRYRMQTAPGIYRVTFQANGFVGLRIEGASSRGQWKKS